VRSQDYITFAPLDPKTNTAPETTFNLLYAEVTVTQPTDVYSSIKDFELQRYDPDHKDYKHSIILADSDFEVLNVVAKQDNTILIDVSRNAGFQLVDIDSSGGVVTVKEGNALFISDRYQELRNKGGFESQAGKPIEMSIRTANGYFVDATSETPTVGKCSGIYCSTTIKQIVFPVELSLKTESEQKRIITELVTQSKEDPSVIDENVLLLTGLLNHPDVTIQITAAQSLTQLPGDASKDALSSLISRPQSSVVILSLVKGVGDTKRTDMVGFLQKILDHEYEVAGWETGLFEDIVYNKALVSLGQIGSDEAHDIVKKIAVENKEYSYGTEALRVLGAFGKKEDIPFIESQIREGKIMSGQKVAALEALAQLDPAKAVPLLEAYVNDKDEDAILRSDALELLVKTKGSEIIPVLEGIVGDFDEKPTMRSDAIKLILGLSKKDPLAVQALIDLAEETPEFKDVLFFGLRNYKGWFAPEIFMAQRDFPSREEQLDLPAKNTMFKDYIPEVKDQYFLNERSRDQLITDRTQVEEIITSKLNLVGNTRRRDSNGKEYDESFQKQKDRLSVVELNKVNFFLDSFASPEVVNQIGNLIQSDLATENVELQGINEFGKPGKFTIDPQKTELGGLVSIEGNRATLIPYQPNCIGNNCAYSGSGSLRADMMTQGFTTFHLHATQADDSKYAGPSSAGHGSKGDRGSSRSGRSDGLVITNLGKGKFNVDYYTPDGEVIDLGNYEYARARKQRRIS